MLIHLVSRDFGFANFPPPDRGVPRMIGSAVNFCTIDLCDPAGQSLPVGSNRLLSESTVTLRDAGGRYVVPRNDQIRMENATAASSHFLLRKVGGQPGDRIRHGDTIALGAFTTNPMRYRWLQLDSRLSLGGITRTYGGSTQRPMYVEVNDCNVYAYLGLTDEFFATPPSTQTGTLTVAVTHEGVQKESLYNAMVNSIAGATYAIGNRPLHALPAGGETVEVRVADGERSRSFPVKFSGLPAYDPCRMYGAGTDSLVVMNGSLSYQPLGSWASSGRPGVQAKEIKMVTAPLFDFINVDAGAVTLNGSNTLGFNRFEATSPANQMEAFTLTVRNGSLALPSAAGGWNCVLSVAPFPMSGFDTTASTPVPSVAINAPALSIDAGGHFAHTFTFNKMTSPPSGRHLFCCTVTILKAVGTGGRMFRRRFAMKVTS